MEDPTVSLNVFTRVYYTVNQTVIQSISQYYTFHSVSYEMAVSFS